MLMLHQQVRRPEKGAVFLYDQLNYCVINKEKFVFKFRIKDIAPASYRFMYSEN